MRRWLLVVTLLVAALAHGDDVNRGWHWERWSKVEEEMYRLDADLRSLATDARMRLRAVDVGHLPEVAAKHRALLADCLAVERRAQAMRQEHPDWLTPEYLWLQARNCSDRAANVLLIDKLTPYLGEPIGGVAPQGTVAAYVANAEARMRARFDTDRIEDRDRDDELSQIGGACYDFLTEARW